MSDVKTWIAERQAKARATEEALSAEHFADPTATVPDLEFLPPDCPICTRPVECDEGFYCEVCCVTWPRNGYGHKASRDVET